MGVRVTEALNATGMSVTIYCGGLSTVGINLAGTGVGTIYGWGAVDGVNFDIPLTLTPFASGSNVNNVIQ